MEWHKNHSSCIEIIIQTFISWLHVSRHHHPENVLSLPIFVLVSDRSRRRLQITRRRRERRLRVRRAAAGPAARTVSIPAGIRAGVADGATADGQDRKHLLTGRGDGFVPGGGRRWAARIGERGRRRARAVVVAAAVPDAAAVDVVGADVVRAGRGGAWGVHLDWGGERDGRDAGRVGSDDAWRWVLVDGRRQRDWRYTRRVTRDHAWDRLGRCRWAAWIFEGRPWLARAVLKASAVPSTTLVDVVDTQERTFRRSRHGRGK